MQSQQPSQAGIQFELGRLRKEAVKIKKGEWEVLRARQLGTWGDVMIGLLGNMLLEKVR